MLKKPKSLFTPSKQDELNKKFMIWSLCPYVANYCIENIFKGSESGSFTILVASIIISINFIFGCWKFYVYIKNYSQLILKEYNNVQHK